MILRSDNKARKQVGQLYRLDHLSCELFEVVKVEDFDEGDKVTFKSKKSLSIRIVDEYEAGIYVHQGPELDFVIHPNAQFFERTHIYFSKFAEKIGVPGDEIEYFKDNRNGKTYIIAYNDEKPVFQVARFINLKFDERSRIASEQAYDGIENLLVLKGPRVSDLPFMLGWVKCFGIDDDLPEEFDYNALPAPNAGFDGAAILAVLDRDGKL